MSKNKRIAAALAASAALAVPALSSAATPRLSGVVGPGETITLKTAAGKRVTSLKAGTYRITIRDRSSDHNYFISGPGLRKQLTGVSFVGTKTVTVRFKRGTYRFVCTPHADDMHGGFRVR